MLYLCVCLPVSNVNFSRIEMVSFIAVSPDPITVTGVWEHSIECLFEFCSCIQVRDLLPWHAINICKCKKKRKATINSAFFCQLIILSFLSSLSHLSHQLLQPSSHPKSELLSLPGRSRPSPSFLILTHSECRCGD